MGYTHYWYRPQVIERPTFAAIVDDFRRVVPVLEAKGVRLADGSGEGEALIDYEAVCFNGPINCGHPRNSELVLPWPDANAGGVMGSDDAITGNWWAGPTIQHRTCDGDCSYETFAFPMIDQTNTTLYEGGRVFDFCKTAFRPYDLAVNVFLIIAKHHLGDAILIRSDGTEANWFDAKLLCAAELGYGLDFALTDERPAEMPEPKPERKPQPWANESTAQIAKRIRAALKEAFPGVKFSVRSSNYSMGSSIDIRWTDGPTKKQVKPIAEQFESVRYDEYSGEILSGGNRYIHCNREASLELQAKALTLMFDKYGSMADMDDWSRERELYRTIEEIDCTPPAPKPTATKKRTARQDKPAAAPADATAAYWVTGAWSWLSFTEKPAAEVLEALKGDGWRWSKKRASWYNLDGKQPPACVAYQERTA